MSTWSASSVVTSVDGSITCTPLQGGGTSLSQYVQQGVTPQLTYVRLPIIAAPAYPVAVVPTPFNGTVLNKVPARVIVDPNIYRCSTTVNNPQWSIVPAPGTITQGSQLVGETFYNALESGGTLAAPVYQPVLYPFVVGGIYSVTVPFQVIVTASANLQVALVFTIGSTNGNLSINQIGAFKTMEAVTGYNQIGDSITFVFAATGGPAAAVAGSTVLGALYMTASTIVAGVNFTMSGGCALGMDPGEDILIQRIA